MDAYAELLRAWAVDHSKSIYVFSHNFIDKLLDYDNKYNYDQVTRFARSVQDWRTMDKVESHIFVSCFDFYFICVSFILSFHYFSIFYSLFSYFSSLFFLLFLFSTDLDILFGES